MAKAAVTMYYNKTECPWCGNVISIHADKRLEETAQKCRWCRKPVAVKISWKGRKANLIPRCMEFSEDVPKDFQRRTYSSYKDRFAMSQEGES